MERLHLQHLATRDRWKSEHFFENFISQYPISIAHYEAIYQLKRPDFQFFRRFLCENANDYGLDLSATDDNGWNALMYAAGLGQLDIMELLTSHGVPHRLANDGRTILMQAASFGDLQTIEYLLEDEEFNLDIYQEDSEGWNAIHYAIHGRIELLYENIYNFQPDGGQWNRMISSSWGRP